SVGAAQAAAHRTREADVIARREVVFREEIGPTGIELHPVAAEHRRVEVGFEQPGARPPDVEVAVAARLEQQEDAHQEADQHHGQGRGFGVAVGRRERNPSRDHGPVGRAVKARAPHRAAVDLAAIKMRQRSDLRRAELGSLSGRERTLVLLMLFSYDHRWLSRTERKNPSRKSDTRGARWGTVLIQTATRTECPDSEVRTILRHARLRTSES